MRHEAKLRPTAHDLLFHRVLFEVHSLKLLAAHCFISNQCESLHSGMFSYFKSFIRLKGQRSPPCLLCLSVDLLPENCVEEKTKSFDPNAVMAEIKHHDRTGVQLK